MAENAVAKQRGPGKPFTKGKSGNPAGKPRGCRHKATRAAQALLEGEVEALTRKAVQKALEGDTAALRLCLERICPPMKESPIRAALKLPATITAENAPQVFATILKAVASGGLCPAKARPCRHGAEMYLQATEYTELAGGLRNSNHGKMMEVGNGNSGDVAAAG
jgi:hypothetical protein